MATSVHRIQAETERAQQKGEGSSPEGSRTKRNSLPETDLDAQCFVQTQISHSPSVNRFPSLAPKLPHSFREKYLQIKRELKPCIDRFRATDSLALCQHVYVGKMMVD